MADRSDNIDAARARELLLLAPDGWWANPGAATVLVRQFQRHVVALGLVATRGAAEEFELYSGFLLEHRDTLHWITAGHGLEEVDRLRKDTDVRVRMARWYDAHHQAAAAAIPTDLNSMTMKFGQYDQLDIGAVWFKDHEVALLRASVDTSPFTSEVWMGNATGYPEGLYVIGYPRQWHRPLFSTSGRRREFTFKARVAAIPVIEVIDPATRDQSQPFWSRPHCIYGRLRLDSAGAAQPLDDIVGVSGGPLLSVERTTDGRIRYRLWGVQSAWLASERVVRVEPIEQVIGMLDEIYGQFERWSSARSTASESSDANTPGSTADRKPVTKRKVVSRASNPKQSKKRRS